MIEAKDIGKYLLALLTLAATPEVAIPLSAVEIIGGIALDLLPTASYDQKVRKQFGTALKKAISATAKEYVISNEDRNRLVRLTRTCNMQEQESIEEALEKYCSTISDEDITFPDNIAMLNSIKDHFSTEAKEYPELSRKLIFDVVKALDGRFQMLDPKSHPRCDNESYREAFSEPLFLEASLPDHKIACLCDVYILPKYSYSKESASLCVYELIRSFLINRESTTIQQDTRFPVINKKIIAIMLRGKPGSGKSSFVSYLSINLVQEINDRKVFFIRLRDMLEDQINTPDPIQGILSYMNAREEALENAVLVLDGLDEICAIYHRINFHEYLKRLLQNLNRISGLQTILTSRSGYFSIDADITNYCLTIDIDNWNNADLTKWSELYAEIHPDLAKIVQQNALHLQDEQYGDKKTIFAVPILFYMASARGELLERHKSICSVYDAVLTDVFERRMHDTTPYSFMQDLISPSLSRQICREIAFAMFRIGRVSSLTNNDPFLAPDEVTEAVEKAMVLQPKDGASFDEDEKKKVKDMYALTFYYNKNELERNAVEFAHKSIAEYFIAEKMIELLYSIPPSSDRQTVCQCLAECFGYMPITADIALFLKEKIDISRNSSAAKALKKVLEASLRQAIISSELFVAPKEKKSQLHYLDRAVIMLKSSLVLFEYLDCSDSATQSIADIEPFNIIIANTAKIVSTTAQYNILLPFCLNGFQLSNGDFSCTEFSEAHLCEAILKDSKFTDANLPDANMNHSIITCTDFSGANLAGADMTDLEADAVDFTQAKLQGADLSNSRFTRTSFEAAELQEALLANCVFDEGCHFEDANLFGADLSGADISRANIEGILFEDEENEEREGEPYELSKLVLSKQQFDYLESLGVKINDDCAIV